MLEYGRPIAAKCSTYRMPLSLLSNFVSRCLRSRSGFPPVVLAIEFEKIERKEQHASVVGSVPERVKVWQAIGTDPDSFAVEDNGRDAKAIDCLNHERVAFGVVPSLFCKKTHVVADPPGDNPEAVMFDFMDPTLARGSFHDPGREARPIPIQHALDDIAATFLFRESAGEVSRTSLTRTA